MHFFYLDEAGDTGKDLESAEQPIFILGGISVNDKTWRKTTDAVQRKTMEFFGGSTPENFELHAHELCNQQGPFAGRARDDCNRLTLDLLNLIVDLKHRPHFIGIDKAKLLEHGKGDEHKVIDCMTPYLPGFNYQVSYLERFVSDARGRSARGMIIIDEKKEHLKSVDALTHFRRFEVPKPRQLRRLVEFSHTKKFLECDNGYRNEWPQEAKNFYASCYRRVQQRMWRTNLLDIKGTEEQKAHELLKLCWSTHNGQWKRKYSLV